VFNL
jgi:hypothetical protein